MNTALGGGGSRRGSDGLTIVELLIVMVIIGILATIVVVSYSGITNKAHEASLQSDVDSASTLLDIYRAGNHKYPQDPKDANGGNALPASGDNTISYVVSTDGKRYCVAASRDGVSYRKSNNTTNRIEQGDCSNVSLMTSIQSITTSTCSTARTVVADARDRHTYWIQKLADGKCWMLTSLAYAGGGANNYNDAWSLVDGTNDSDYTFDSAKYYIPDGSNVTMEPTDPSINTDGLGQYGYLYNWCAAMGGQIGTSTCSVSASTDDWNHSLSICPHGWRLPTGVSGGEFNNLNTLVNSGSYLTDTGLRSVWLGQYSGAWGTTFYDQDYYAYYWSSSQKSASSAYFLSFNDSYVDYDYNDKDYGHAVRCVAAV